MENNINVEIAKSIRRLKARQEFIPTGLQDQIIMSIGEAKHNHYHIQSFNNLGKTTLWVNIVRQICSPSNSRYFESGPFKRWDYPKSIAVVTTKENLKEAGAVEKNISQWWPDDLHDGGKKQDAHFKSLYQWKSGFTVKLFSNEQPPNQFEGPEFGMWIMDEPGQPHMVSAFNTRLKHGGIGLTIFTPVTLPGGFFPGPIVDILEDLEARGRRVCWLNFTDIRANDKDTGTPNRFNEKRGLYSSAEIDTFVTGVSSQDIEARVKGTLNIKGGRIYPMFNPQVHVKDLDMRSEYFKKSNKYMGIDPHPSHYPAMLWLAVTPDEDVIIWNEWPTYQSLNNRFYDQIRTTEHFFWTIEQQSELIKLMDMDFPIMKRFMDPRFAVTTENERADIPDVISGLRAEFLTPPHLLKFELPPFEAINMQRTRIHELMHYDRQRPVSFTNRPRFYVLPHCTNTRRCLERHYLENDGSGREAPEYKDFIDIIRYILGGIGEIRYIPPVVVLPSQRSKSLDQRGPAKVIDPRIEGMRDVSQ